MSVFKSSIEFQASILDSARHAFGLPSNSGGVEFFVKNFGTIVEVYEGENKGVYDVYKDNGVYVFVEA